MHNKCKRKVFDRVEAEQSYKFKVDPFVMKENLEIETMRQQLEKRITQRWREK